MIAKSFALVLCGLAACAKSSPIVEVRGGCANVYQGQVCTWANTREGKVVELGATVPLASIENALQQSPNPMTWPPVAVASLNFPESARRGGGFTQLTMYWEPAGHVPASFMTPHFDFHFNLVSPSELRAINCADTTKPAKLPDEYVLPDIELPPPVAKLMGVPVLVGLCVPQMGMHALLQSELESKDMLRGSMVLGYYHGTPIFLEPMVSQAMLLEKKSFDLRIPPIPGIGAQPTGFHAYYDPARKEYRFIFSRFVATE